MTILNRFAILVTVYALITVGSGAIVTSSMELVGAENSLVANPAGATIHPLIGDGLAGLTLALAIWLWTTRRGVLRILAILAVVLCASDAIVAFSPPVSPGIAAQHAWIAAALFATLAAIVMLTSVYWERKPEMVGDQGFRLLRPLAIATPPLVLIQALLGALYRHKLTGVLWHMGGALLVALLTLVGSMVVLQNYPAHRALKSAATALISIVLAQVAFGVTAFTLQLLDVDNPLALELAALSHVVVGSLTLAASVIFAMVVRRSIRPGAAES